MSVTKQFIITSLFALVALFVAMSLVSYFNLRSMLVSEQQRMVGNACNSSAAYIESQTMNFMERCRSFAGQPISGSLLETEDPGTIRDGFMAMRDRSPADNLLFADFDGEFLADLSDNIDTFNEVQANLVETAMSTTETVPSLSFENGQSVLSLALVVGSFDDPLGVIVFERYLDKAYVDKIAAIVGMDLQLCFKHEAQLSTLLIADTDAEYLSSSKELQWGPAYTVKTLVNADVIDAQLKDVLWKLSWVSALVTAGIILVLFVIIKRLRKRMDIMLHTLHDNVKLLHGMSEQSYNSSVEMNVGVEQQADSIESSRGFLSEVVAVANENQREARDADSEIKIIGKEVLESASAVSAMTDQVSQISAATKQITEILGALDSIAFQTNLLALNASVEAARAGEAGRGFAVVAEEVRNLARRSAEAAQRSSGLIHEAQTSSDSGVAAAHNVLAKVQLIEERMQNIVNCIECINMSSESQQEKILTIQELMQALGVLSNKNTEYSGKTQEMSTQLSQYADTLYENSNQIAKAIIG